MNTIQEQITTAEVAIKSGNFAQAETISRKLLAQDLQQEEKVAVLLYLSESFWQRGFAQEALSFAQQAFSIAKELEQKELQAKALGNIGIVYGQLSDYPRTLEYLHQALSLNEELDNKSGVAIQFANIGNVYRELSDYSRALEYYHQALSLNEELDNKSGVAIQFANIGIVYRELSDYPRALEYHHQALSVDEELGNRSRMAITLGNIGIVYSCLSDYPRALEYYHQALSLHEELGNKSGVAMNLSNLGIVYSQLSEHYKALENYHQALAIAEELGNKSGVAITLGNIGHVYSDLSDYPRALEYYHQALSLHEELGNRSRVAILLSNIGSVYQYLSDYPRALEYYHQALAMDEELGNKSGVARHLARIGTLTSKSDFIDYNPAKAEEYLLQALTLNVELGTKQQLYEVYKSLSDLYKQQARWQEYAEYLQQYYETEKQVQSEEAKKLADKFAFERQIAVMEKEREVTDMLLHKFLPSPVVNEVKAKEGKILVQQFNSISVLFADLVGFTKLSLSIKPEIMIEMLNFIFTKFDSIIKENGGHRIRTMGDGYFAICGAPDLVENHQYKLAKAALKFMEDIILPENIRKHLPEGTVLDIRIGLHCGEAVCGMVGGLEKWQYDAYGDTINTASRMESHGEAGKIHISEDFKNSLLDYNEFEFIPREPMFIKGKGLMNTYFLQ